VYLYLSILVNFLEQLKSHGAKTYIHIHPCISKVVCYDLAIGISKRAEKVNRAESGHKLTNKKSRYEAEPKFK
jgi:hypothetical protein